MDLLWEWTNINEILEQLWADYGDAGINEELQEEDLDIIF